MLNRESPEGAVGVACPVAVGSGVDVPVRTNGTISGDGGRGMFAGSEVTKHHQRDMAL